MSEKTPKKTDDLICGRNSVEEALKSGRSLNQLFAAGAEGSAGIRRLVSLAKSAGVPVKEVDSRKLDSLCGGKNHQGVAAFCAAHEYADIEDILEIAKLRPLWGGDIKEPQFVLPNVTVKAEQITRHSNNKWNIIELPIAKGKKIKVYQTQNAGEEGYNKLLMREENGFNNPPKMLKMDLVVKMKMWEIEGQQYPYLQLVDYNVEKGRKARW